VAEISQARKLMPVQSRIPQLDGLRGIAILLVLLGHQAQKSIQANLPCESLAALGVLLFFVLSGFLITTILISEQQYFGTVNLRRFYIRRILRLAPAFVIFLGSIYFLDVFGYIDHIPAYEYVACIFYVRNIFGRSIPVSHLWSLSLEEQFYSVWPPFLKFVRLRVLRWVALLLTIAMCVWRGIAIKMHLFDYQTGIYYLRPYFRFDSILIGCCLAAWLDTIAIVARIVKSMPVSFIWLAVVIWTMTGERPFPSLYLTIQTIGAAWIVWRAVTGTSFLILNNEVLRFFGRISYSLYLWQQLFVIATKPAWAIIHQFPYDWFASILFAVASYFLIERPFLRLKTMYEAKTKGQASVPSRNLHRNEHVTEC
jgi:peptidoglycan/LPS O-acetylase OafA/YrhL